MSFRGTRHEGALASWNDQRGFGFIDVDGSAVADRASGGRDRVFAHISAFPPREMRPAPGERISFVVEHTSEGKVRARNIRYLSSAGRAPRTRKHTPGGMSYVLLTAFAIALGILTGIGALPWLFAALYLVMSLITYAIYASDKKAAQTRQWRVTESVLLSLGLLGGWPGAIFAQQRLRHKTQKPMFRRAFWGTIVLNIVALAIITTAMRELILDVAGQILEATSP